MDRELRCFFSAVAMLVMAFLCGMFVVVARDLTDWVAAGVWLAGARVMGEMAWDYWREEKQ